MESRVPTVRLLRQTKNNHNSSVLATLGLLLELISPSCSNSMLMLLAKPARQVLLVLLVLVKVSKMTVMGFSVLYRSLVDQVLHTSLRLRLLFLGQTVATSICFLLRTSELLLLDISGMNQLAPPISYNLQAQATVQLLNCKFNSSLMISL